MSGLDALITLFLLSSALTGYRRGIFREVLISGLWLPTLLAIGYVITQTITPDGINAENTSILWTLASFYLLAALVIWVLDLGLVQPYFKGSLQGTARLISKLMGMLLALLRSWWVIVLGLGLYAAFQAEPDPELMRHGNYLPYMQSSAQKLKTWLEDSGYIQHEMVIYSDEAFTYQSEVDEAKDLLKDAFTSPWTPNEATPHE